MRYAIILLIVAAALTLGGTLLSQYEGYVELGLGSGTYQMPLWYFIVALAALVITAMLLFKLVWTVIRIPAIAKRFGKKRRQYRAGDLLQKGMLAMGKGQWKQAESLLSKGARISHQAKKDPSLFLAAAAQAAQNLGAEDRRDQYLLEARQLSAEGVDTLTAALSEASLHLDQKAPEKALAVLEPHKTSHFLNPKFLQIECEAYAQLDRYDDVWRLLPSMKKHFPSKSAYQARVQSVAKSLFDSQNSALDTVEQAWSELPKLAKKDEGLLLSFVSALIYRGQEEKAEKMLSSMIKSEYSDPLIHAYTQLEVGSSNERLRKMEGWLKYHPENAYLNYGAAKFAYQSEQHEKAKTYAETSMKELAMPETLALLGKIYEALGDSSHALQAYKGSVALTYSDSVSDVAVGEVLGHDEKMALPANENSHDDGDSRVVEAKPA